MFVERESAHWPAGGCAIFTISGLDGYAAVYYARIDMAVSIMLLDGNQMCGSRRNARCDNANIVQLEIAILGTRFK